MLVTVFSVLTRFLSFIYKIIISRYFGAESVGIFQMSVSFLGFFIALNSGLPLVLSRKIAEKTNELDDFRKVTFCLLYSVLLCSVISIILILSKDFLSIYFQNKKAITVFYILLPALFSTTIYSIIRAWLLGHKMFLSFSSTELLEEILTIFITFVLTMTLSYSGEILIAMSVAIADVVCIVVLLIIYFAKGGKLVKPTNQIDLIKSSIPITTNRIVSSLTGTFSAFIIPYMLMEYGETLSMATATFGRFTGMCMPLISAPSALIGSLAIVLIPELASLKITGYNGASKKIEKSLTFSILIAGLFVGIFLPLGKEITQLVFNDETSGYYVSISAVIIFPLVLNQLSTSILNTLNRENITLRNFIIGNIPLLLIITFATKYIGILSLAIGFFVSFFITSTLNLYSLNKEGKLSVKLYKNIFLVVIFSLLCSYFIELITKYLKLGNLLTIIICSIIYLILYFTLCYFSGLTNILKKDE